MKRRTTLLCAAASLLCSLVIVACSSFTTAPATAAAGADGATPPGEDASVSPSDADSGDAGGMLDSGFSFAVTYPECSGWTLNHGATIQSVLNLATDAGACRVCAPDAVGPPFVSKTISSMVVEPGKYQISATAQSVGILGASSFYGVGFQAEPVIPSGSVTSPSSSTPTRILTSVIVPPGETSFQAMLEIASDQGGCVDFSDITIAGPT